MTENSQSVINAKYSREGKTLVLEHFSKMRFTFFAYKFILKQFQIVVGGIDENYSCAKSCNDYVCECCSFLAVANNKMYRLIHRICHLSKRYLLIFHK